MITNQQLRATFLSPQMKYYFDRKLAPLPSGQVDVRIEELLKYLNMAVHCIGELAVSREIDEVWHHWILETAEYANLCAKLHGRIFLHHSSYDYEEYIDRDKANRRIDLKFDLSILSSYVLNYGPFEESRLKYWPFAGLLMDRLQWDVDQLNDWLSSAADLRTLQAAEAPTLNMAAV